MVGIGEFSDISPPFCGVELGAEISKKQLSF